MVTMLKEKVNTHFSFPMRLDMSDYVEKHLMPTHYQGFISFLVSKIFITIIYLFILLHTCYRRKKEM